jgi:hypothetical protein
VRGEWHKGHLHGEGNFVHIDGDEYVGEFRQGLPGGRGTYRWADGTIYEVCKAPKSREMSTIFAVFFGGGLQGEGCRTREGAEPKNAPNPKPQTPNPKPQILNPKPSIAISRGSLRGDCRMAGAGNHGVTGTCTRAGGPRGSHTVTVCMFGRAGEGKAETPTT